MYFIWCSKIELLTHTKVKKNKKTRPVIFNKCIFLLCYYPFCLKYARLTHCDYTPCIVLLFLPIKSCVTCTQPIKAVLSHSFWGNIFYLFPWLLLGLLHFRFITLTVALLIDQDFQPAASSLSNFIRLNCNKPVALCVLLQSYPPTSVTLYMIFLFLVNCVI